MAIFGWPTTLKDLVAAVIKMMCWRCCTSWAAWWVDWSPLTDKASRSGWAENWLIMTLAPTAMTTAAATVVIKKARTLLCVRLLPCNRLRCCDNAVLPSAKPAGQAAKRASTAAKTSDSGKELATVSSGRYLPGQNDRNEEPTPLPHHVARSGGIDKAFPLKKLCCVAPNLCLRGHGLAASIVTIT